MLLVLILSNLGLTCRYALLIGQLLLIQICEADEGNNHGVFGVIELLQLENSLTVGLHYSPLLLFNW